MLFSTCHMAHLALVVWHMVQFEDTIASVIFISAHFCKESDAFQDHFASDLQRKMVIFQNHKPTVSKRSWFKVSGLCLFTEGRTKMHQNSKPCQVFLHKGPLVKLKRWFSWLESAMSYKGELWVTKMVLDKELPSLLMHRPLKI